MGEIRLLTGNGEGKTTSALGHALRAMGHGHKVIVIQFLKGRKYLGEYRFQEWEDNYKAYQFGRESFVDLKNPRKEDIKLAKEGLKFVATALKEKPFLLLLDEINLAAAYGLVKAKDVISALKNIPKETTVYLTGRNAPKELIDFADYAAEIKTIKMKKPFSMNEGLEY
jgi:cob(I)alamin adenosyltransferase